MSAKLLALALPLTGSLALTLALPLLFAGGDNQLPAACPASETADQIDRAAVAIRQQESGGNYQARADGSTASGAYQFTDATWADYAGYPHAWQAPPTVQDANATDHINGILHANNGDISAVPVVWYIGYLPPTDDPAWDTIPSPDAGNRLTPRQYQDTWITTYTEAPNSSVSPPEDCSSRNDPPQRPNPGLTTVEGITVDAQIAPQLEQLVRDARRSGYQLTGTGYRSHDQQIELRRQHCGTSHYATYDMPSSQCSPPTARPGASQHEQGLAIDLTCDGTLIRDRHSACFTWLTANAPPLGLHNLPSEPWHWSTGR